MTGLAAAAQGQTARQHELTLTHLFDAPRTLVWRAFTEPEHLLRWWFPEGCRSTLEAMELRPGGAFRLLIEGPDGSSCRAQGRYREIDPPRRLVWQGEETADNPGGAGIPPRALVTLTLEEEAGKTRLTLHTLFETAAAKEAAMESGLAREWPKGLARLAGQLADASD